MSADFEKVLVKDPRLDVTDTIKYAVIKGGQNVTNSKFAAVSASSSQLVFNVQVPSEQTIIDRRVLLRATLTVGVTSVGGLANTLVCYGVNAALASFPLHQCFDTLSATINNNTVTCNIKDVLPAILRLLDDDDLIYHNGASPAFNDIVGLYYNNTPASDYAYLANSNTGIWGVTDAKRFHRGCFPIKANTTSAPGVTPIVNAAFNDGATLLNYITYEVTEPLLLSPFMFSNTKSNNQGFYGIQNMNIVANLNNGARCFRGPTPGASTFLKPSGTGASQGISGISMDMYSVKPELLFTFITPHPSDLMPARNIVPYYELPRYINSSQEGIALAVTTAGGGALEMPTRLAKFNAIQLNQIPDKLIFYTRLKASAADQPWGQPDVSLPITAISINFNNNSGILASATTQELWQMSKNNGANSSWPEFLGYGTGVNNDGGSPATGQPTVNAVPLSGSYLVLEFGKDIQLTEDFYAAGSLGNFNLQCNVTVANNTTYAAAANDWELVVITMNSGVFVCERGTSATYTGILTKQDVLDASAQEYYTHDDVKRLVGGGFFDSIKSGLSSLAKKGMKMGKEHLRKHGKSYMQQGLKMAANTGKKMLQKYTAPDEDEE
jgi:hypothetical protein